MRTKIDVEKWNRCEYYRFFGAMNDPFTGVTVRVDVTRFYQKIKQENRPVYLSMMHCVLRVVNSIDELRVRIDAGEVYEFDCIHVSPTVGREDGSFGYAFFEYNQDERLFIEESQRRTDIVKQGSGLMLTADCGRIDTIHYTCLPWVDFTDLKHAGSPSPDQSIPKVSIGKIVEREGRLEMSISLWVHHGLADGRHMGLFVERFQEELNR